MTAAGDGTSEGQPTPAGAAPPAPHLLEDSAEDLYESAPCGYLSTLLDGRIIKINGTLLTWLGYRPDEVVGRMGFVDLLTVGGRIYHETHLAPLLRMQGEVDGVALELRAADGGRLPVLVSSSVRTGADGRPQLIRTTLTDARDRRSYEEELLRARTQADQARAESDRDRERLREVFSTLQQSLLPPALPDVPGLDAVAYYHTASPYDLGGDFYDLFPVGESRWVFFLGDVCGKGAEAAAVTSLARHTLRAAALYDPDPVAMVSTLNAVLHERYRAGDLNSCGTVIVGTLNRRQGTYDVVVASGGHPPALLLRADGAPTYLATPGGLLVGVVPRAHFTTATAEATLDAGDTLLLYTDGLTEARVAGGQGGRYSPEALHAFVTDLGPTTAGHLVTTLSGLLDGFGTGLDDDAALLSLGVPRS